MSTCMQTTDAVHYTASTIDQITSGVPDGNVETPGILSQVTTTSENGSIKDAFTSEVATNNPVGDGITETSITDSEEDTAYTGTTIPNFEISTVQHPPTKLRLGKSIYI